MHEISLIDETFDLNFSSEYNLSIQVSLDGFSFCILDKLQKKYVVLQHYPLIVGKIQFLSKKIEAIFEQEPKLQATYKGVNITYSTNKSTLVPTEFFDERQTKEVLQRLHEIDRCEDIEVSPMKSIGQYIVYAYPKDIRELFNAKFSSYTLKHKSVALIATVLKEKNSKNSILLNFERKYFRMIVFKNEKIEFFNSFYYKNEFDFLYYTLNVCSQLNLDPEKDELLIGGYMAPDSPYIRQLKKYWASIRFLTPDPDYFYSYTFDRIPQHYFVSLLNSIECEL